MMIERLFLAHPRSVDESYGEHMRLSGRIGLRLIGGRPRLPDPRRRAGVSSAHGAAGLIRRLNAELQGRTASESELNGTVERQA